MNTVCVVGAGIVGLWSAFELRRRGVRVIILDQGDPGHGCSWQNAGWVVPAMSGPLPAPGTVRQSLRWMLTRDSPLYIRPAVDLELLRWLWAFWRRCNPRDYAEARTAIARLHDGVMNDFDELRREQAAFEMHESGLLFAFRTEAELREHADEMQAMARLGWGPTHTLGPAEVRRTEPALGTQVVGGLLVERARHVRPEDLVTALAARLRTMDVDIRAGTRVNGFARDDARITACETSAGPVHADRFLVAAGVWTGRLVAQLECAIPLQPGKGYSITVRAPTAPLRRPVYLSEARIACSPFDGLVRFAGTMEFSGLNGAVDPRRLSAIVRAVRRFLPDLALDEPRIEWMGMRPVTPDGLPVIGRVPGFDNIYVATGHAMLGVSLAGPTARAVGDLIMGGEQSAVLVPFDPARFARRPAAALKSGTIRLSTKGGRAGRL